MNRIIIIWHRARFGKHRLKHIRVVRWIIKWKWLFLKLSHIKFLNWFCISISFLWNLIIRFFQLFKLFNLIFWKTQSYWLLICFGIFIEQKLELIIIYPISHQFFAKFFVFKIYFSLFHLLIFSFIIFWLSNFYFN